MVGGQPRGSVARRPAGVGEALRVVVMGHVAGAGEQFEAAAGHRLVGRAAVLDRDDRSCSPHMISVGSTAARCEAVDRATRWPGSITERTV